MRDSSLRLFSALISDFDRSKKTQLLSFLSLQDKERYQELPKVKSIDLSTFSLSSRMRHVHYSWFIPTLKAYAKHDCLLFLAALGPAYAKSLAKHLETKENPSQISTSAASYLKNLLYSSLLDDKDLLPESLLPPSDLNFLATFSQKKLLYLIEGLAMFDLMQEMKHIVDPKKLKAIQNALSDEQKEFLKKFSHISSISFYTKMGLDRWDGDRKVLLSLLHRRGIKLLASVLTNEHGDLIWYVSHHLDIGRGGGLLRLIEKKMTSNKRAAIMQVVVQIAKSL
jgi:hypothetical protein